MKPKRSYTIWFSQRTGSSLLTTAFEAINMAGKPHEWFNCDPDLLKTFNLPNHAALQKYLWEAGSTSNKVFGIKHSFYEPHFSRLIEALRQFPICAPQETNRVRIWESAFPNHRHIFMTRRNKVRLAVSWWKAIQSREWHRLPGEPSKSVDLTNAYSFEAIHHLYDQCSMREAGIQEFFSEGNILPLTIVYEDFIQNYEQTIRTMLNYLEIDAVSVKIPSPPLAPTADSVSEEWVKQFREDCQNGWTNRGW
jgi:trehalose 2-sulfotransferase